MGVHLCEGHRSPQHEEEAQHVVQLPSGERASPRLLLRQELLPELPCVLGTHGGLNRGRRSVAPVHLVALFRLPLFSLPLPCLGLQIGTPELAIANALLNLLRRLHLILVGN